MSVCRCKHYRIGQEHTKNALPYTALVSLKQSVYLLLKLETLAQLCNKENKQRSKIYKHVHVSINSKLH